MYSTLRVAAAGSLAIWLAAISAVASPAVQRTTNDGIYSKAQAEKAKTQFDKLCASCHPFSASEKKRTRDILLAGDTVLTAWNGRPVEEMISMISLTMPNDGSAVVSEEEAANLVAYILQRNGYPAGPKPLGKDGAGATLAKKKALIVDP